MAPWWALPPCFTCLESLLTCWEDQDCRRAQIKVDRAPAAACVESAVDVLELGRPAHSTLSTIGAAPAIPYSTTYNSSS